MNGSNARETTLGQECYIVIHSNHVAGHDVCAFWTEEKARKSIDLEVDYVKASLVRQGYQPKEQRDALGDPGVYVPDTDIYYEWRVFCTTIE